MFMRRVILQIVLVGLIVPLTAADFTPGAHKRLPCDGNKEWTWDVYIPKAYAAKPDKKFPVVWCCSSAGNPGFWHLEQWAEKNEALLIAMNDPKNGLNFTVIHKMQDDVIATTEGKLRLHPCLRFATGSSGGAWQSMYIANRYPDKHAGVVMQNHSANGTICEKHVSVAFIHGDADKTHPLSSVKKAYERLMRQGNPVKLLVVPGRNHKSATTEEITGMLDWMFGYQRVAHPKLPPEDREAVKKEMTERSKACGAIQDPAARLTEAEFLFGMPNIERLPDYKLLVAAWFKARRELAEAKPDAAEKHEDLYLLLEDPRSRLVPSAEKSAVNKLLTELRRDRTVRAEYEALGAYARTQKAEAAAGNKRGQLKMVAQAYQAIAQRYPKTRAGKKAAEDAKRMSE